ncbi:flagellar motor switch protein FliG [Dokdonella sp. MW10]|uniref:flagellar motor switch protein FliG n=1 Tax=Dokdonella sp. MW10 TaxID=2992926 RepID=UPI003F7F4219
MTGAQRASVLLLSLGEKEAAEVLKHMSARDVQAIGSAMTSLGSISRSQADNVLDTFTAALERETALGVGTEEYVRRMLITALGEDKAARILDRIKLGRDSKGLEALKWMEGRSIAEMIGGEHPQIVAIVMAHLDTDQAAEVLNFLPDAIRHDVIMRIATLDGVQPSALHELDQIMERRFAGGQSSFSTSSVGGIKAAAQILNQLDSGKDTKILESIVALDGELGQRIQELMFVFDDLIGVDDRGMQALLREVSTDRLVIALKGCDQGVREKVFSNMSKRAADMLRDDLEVKGPVRLSEVDAAQKEILTVARRLAEQGQISLGSGGEEYV